MPAKKTTSLGALAAKSTPPTTDRPLNPVASRRAPPKPAASNATKSSPRSKAASVAAVGQGVAKRHERRFAKVSSLSDKRIRMAATAVGLGMLADEAVEAIRTNVEADLIRICELSFAVVELAKRKTVMSGDLRFGFEQVTGQTSYAIGCEAPKTPNLKKMWKDMGRAARSHPATPVLVA